MADESNWKACSYYLVRYVPNAEREESLNIGLLLHSAEEQFLDCLFTRDLRRIKRFHPQADVEFLSDLQSHFEQQIQQHEDNLQGFIEGMQQSLSHVIQLAPARPVLAAEPQTQLQQLFERLVGKRQAAVPAADTRMRIKQGLVEALRRARVFDDKRFEKRIPAEPLTHPGNPFHFDFGYRPPMAAGKPNGHLKLVHALSLHRDHDLASVLSLTMGYIRDRQPAELTAIIEGWPARGDKTASHSHRILRDAEIALRPLAEVDAFAKSIREEFEQSALSTN
ncbi:MAG TPA: DUF3037 domain-containing protein [Terriglobia bacterium]|nr:DUF3037 domain-containing protein [Terriglobia bacterium]